MISHLQEWEFYIGVPSAPFTTLPIFLLLYTSVHSPLPGGGGGWSVQSQCIAYPHYQGSKGGTEKWRFGNYFLLVLIWKYWRITITFLSSHFLGGMTVLSQYIANFCSRPIWARKREWQNEEFTNTGNSLDSQKTFRYVIYLGYILYKHLDNLEFYSAKYS